MRKSLLTALLLGAVALSAEASAEAGAAPAAPAQTIELHIDAIGTAVPDYAILPFTYQGVGATREAAEVKRAEAQDGIAAGLAAQGITAPQFVPGEASENIFTCYDSMTCVSMIDGGSVRLDEVPAEAFITVDEASAGLREPAAGASGSKVDNVLLAVTEPAVDSDARFARLWTAKGDGTVRVDGVAKLADVTKALASGARAGGARYDFNDRAKSRKAALADGLARARAEADAYAAGIGYRVVRIKRLSNTGAPFNLPDMLAIISRMEGPGKDASYLAAEFAPVAIDFVLAPK